MDIVLISGRAAVRGRGSWLDMASELACGLVGGGHRVRWLCLARADEDPAPAVDGVEVVVQTASVPPFRSVLGRLSDLPAETELTRWLRRAPADVAHFLGFGGATSGHLPWISAGLGVRTVVTVDPAELLCHRGTLVDETGAACERVDDPARCASCCLTPFRGGLGTWTARLGRMLRWCGDASPFPNETVFANRLDVVIGGLLSAHAVLVPDERAFEQLVALGVPRRLVAVEADRTAAAMLGRYEDLSVVER